MSHTWQESWDLALAYWTDHWRQWIAVGAVVSAWMAVVFVSIPSVTPFIFMEFQPINSKTIAGTYHGELTTLGSHLTGLVVVLAATGILGTIVLTRMLRARGQRGIVAEVVSSAFMTAVSLAAIAALRVPLSGDFLNPAPMVIRGVSLIISLVLIVPWLFWAGPLNIAAHHGFFAMMRQRGREVFFLAWTWMIALVVSELLSASLAWMTTSAVIGSVVLAILIAGIGILHQSVAYFYMRREDSAELRAQTT